MAMNYPYPTSSPTSSGAYTTGIRSALKQKGIADEQITYDPNKGVMISGTPFIRPEKIYAGSSYTSPTGFNTAWENYSKSLTQPTAGTTGVTPTGAPGFTPTTITPGVQPSPINEQINKIIQGLQTYGQTQPAFDPYSSAAYQAAQAQTQRQSQQGIRQARESFGSAGFGRSTGLGERAQRIGQEGTEYLMTQVLPQIQAQEQARRQQEFQNTIAALTPLLGQQTREDLLKQQDISNRVAEAGLTGTYIPQGSQDIINQLIGLKSQAETSVAGGATPETMGQYQAQGDVLRNQLSALGYDISGLGAETSAADVRVPRGVQTIQGRTAALNEDKINQDLKTGLIDQETASFKLQQLKDPNSPVNQAAQIELELKQLEAKYAEPEMIAKIEEIRKRTAQIGAAPYRTQEEIDYDKEKINLIKAQIGEITNKPEKPASKNELESDYITNLDKLTPDKRNQVFTDEKSEIIKDLGKDGYKSLYDMYFDEMGRPRK